MIKERDIATCIILTIVTCGIYSIYWSYKIGKDVYEIKTSKNLPADDNSIIYLVLSILGLGIINYCLIQNDLNKLSTTGA